MSEEPDGLHGEYGPLMSPTWAVLAEVRTKDEYDAIEMLVNLKFSGRMAKPHLFMWTDLSNDDSPFEIRMRIRYVEDWKMHQLLGCYIRGLRDGMQDMARRHGIKLDGD